MFIDFGFYIYIKIFSCRDIRKKVMKYKWHHKKNVASVFCCHLLNEIRSVKTKAMKLQFVGFFLNKKWYKEYFEFIIATFLLIFSEILYFLFVYIVFISEQSNIVDNLESFRSVIFPADSWLKLARAEAFVKKIQSA